MSRGPQSFKSRVIIPSIHPPIHLPNQLSIHPSMHPFLLSSKNQLLSPYPVLGTALDTGDIKNPKDRKCYVHFRDKATEVQKVQMFFPKPQVYKWQS